MTEIERDAYGRPLVVNPATGRKEAYTRISTIAGALDDAGTLVNWKVRHAATGFVQHPDLYERFMAAARASDQNACVEEAMDAAGANVKRELGSAAHDVIHQINLGLDPVVPDFLAADVAAYREATAGWEFVQCETFGVNHQMAIAGSFDMKVRTPDGKVRVADLKTGRYSASKCRIQLYGYSQCSDYPDASTTVPVESDFGLVVNLPLDGKCVVYRSDLNLGRDEMGLAILVRQQRSYARTERSVVASWPKPIGWLDDLIAAATTVDECRALWAVHRESWDETHTALVNLKVAGFGGA